MAELKEGEIVKITIVFLEGGLRAEVKGDQTKKLSSSKATFLTLEGLKGDSKVMLHRPSIRLMEVVQATVTERPPIQGIQAPPTEFKPVVMPSQK